MRGKHCTYKYYKQYRKQRRENIRRLRRNKDNNNNNDDDDCTTTTIDEDPYHNDNNEEDHNNRWLHLPIKIRQVPGDGNCLFHSLSACIAHDDEYGKTKKKSNTKKNKPYGDWLYESSSMLRKKSIDHLRKLMKRTKNSQRYRRCKNAKDDEEEKLLLYLQGNEYCYSTDLVNAACKQYNISSIEYCNIMEQEYYWGGGVEIVALCNVLKRPIHVYELTSKMMASSSSTSVLTPKSNKQNCKNKEIMEEERQNKGKKKLTRFVWKKKHRRNDDGEGICIKKKFAFRRVACFGSPKYDRKDPLHIVSVDSNFPDISPGEEKYPGNHFLPILPKYELI